MAVAIFKRLARPEQKNQRWQIESAGTWATDGLPASRNGQQVMASMGMDISDHRSRRVTREMLEDFDLILTMEAGHKEALQVEFPDLADRVFLLSEMAGEQSDIEDPIGGPLEEYEATARELEHLLGKGLKQIFKLLDVF